jgi:hypothetical protein
LLLYILFLDIPYIGGKMNFVVKTARTTDFPDPISLRKGDIVEIGERSNEEEWANWIMSKFKDKSGWVPEQIIKVINNKQGVIIEDYTANELTVSEGDIIVSNRELNGWIFGYNTRREREMGWVPKENVEEI